MRDATLLPGMPAPPFTLTNHRGERRSPRWLISVNGGAGMPGRRVGCLMTGSRLKAQAGSRLPDRAGFSPEP
jgi:hypothetical protein